MDTGYHSSERIRSCIHAPLIPQRSDEWFQLRRGRITGSMCDSLTGNNRFQSRDQLVCEKAGMPTDFKGNAATQHGVDNEDVAIRLYEGQTGRKVFELGLTQHPTIDILAHSPDGISLAPTSSTTDTDPLLLEVKCPYTREIKPGVVPKYYMGQLQLGMYVFDVKAADFVQYKPAPFVLDVTRVPRDEEWLDKNMPVFARFWDDVQYWKKAGWKRHPFVQKERRPLFKALLDQSRRRLREEMARP